MQLMNIAFSLNVQGSGFYLEVALCMMAVAVQFIKDNKFDEFILLKEISPLEEYPRAHACRYLKQIISLTVSKSEKQILRLALLALQKEWGVYMKIFAGVLLFLAIVITNIIIERDGNKRMLSKDEIERHSVGPIIAIGFAIILFTVILILLLWE